MTLSQRLPRHHQFHLGKEDFAPGLLPLACLLGIRKLIQFVAATAEKDNISIVSRRFECPVFLLESVFVGEDICLRKYPRNRRARATSARALWLDA
jgi:hypothetical protein